jgi:hypothetical protein
MVKRRGRKHGFLPLFIEDGLNGPATAKTRLKRRNEHPKSATEM